jgi:hypothetical protein
MEQINHFINNMTVEEFNGYPEQHLVDDLGVRIPVRLVGTVYDNQGIAYILFLEHDRTPIFIPIPPEPAAMAPPFIDRYPADEMEDVEERVSPRQAARRASRAASRHARMSRRADRRAALHAFEQQQLQRQQPGLFNPHNIFQQPQPQQQPEPLLVRPLPVPPTPANPASRRQRRKASRLSRERREARIRAGYVVGGKTRRHRN